MQTKSATINVLQRTDPDVTAHVVEKIMVSELAATNRD
jgi:hypothetical protein